MSNAKVKLTKHACRRLRQRYPDMTLAQCREWAVMARAGGIVTRAKNGCKKYSYLGREFVFDETRATKMVLVTVI